jgi:hypothetical protein
MQYEHEAGSIEQPTPGEMGVVQTAGFVGTIVCPFATMGVMGLQLTTEPTVTVFALLVVNIIAIVLSRI